VPNSSYAPATTPQAQQLPKPATPQATPQAPNTIGQQAPTGMQYDGMGNLVQNIPYGSIDLGQASPQFKASDMTGVSRSYLDIQSKLDENKRITDELRQKYITSLTPSQTEQDLGKQLLDLRAKIDQGDLALEKGQTEQIYGDTVKPLDLAMGRAGELQRQDSFRKQEQGLAEKNLIARLGLEQDMRKTAIQGAETLLDFAGKDQELYFKIQERLDKEQASILDRADKLDEKARQSLSTILSTFKGLTIDKLDPQSQLQVAQLATQAGIPFDLIVQGMQTVKDAQTTQDSFERARIGISQQTANRLASGSSGAVSSTPYSSDLDAMIGNVFNIIPSENGKVAFRNSIAKARNDSDKINTIATVALKNSPSEFRNDFVNQSVGIKQIEKALSVLDKGVQTGLIENGKQYVFNLFGRDFDPNLAAIDSYIISAIQPYRNSITGAAWGDQEDGEYQQLFGSTKFAPEELRNRLERLKNLLIDKSVSGLNVSLSPLGEYNPFSTESGVEQSTTNPLSKYSNLDTKSFFNLFPQ
jgi:hypothetical protein